MILLVAPVAFAITIDGEDTAYVPPFLLAIVAKAKEGRATEARAWEVNVVASVTTTTATRETCVYLTGSAWLILVPYCISAILGHSKRISY